MRTLIWKELRENLKWALLAMLALGTAEMSALYPGWGESNSYGNEIVNGITLCRESFLTVTTFGCAAVGFLLGLIQILPELKRDRWAALLHRPVSRGDIYRSKAVAGLLLYFLAAVPPFLVAIWLAATPGHFNAPFIPEMVFPGTVDTCMGAAYYFAALAVTLQRGGWIGLRAFPLLAAIHTSYFILSHKIFYVALEASVLMALALFTAAWGEMLSPDLLRARPWLGKLAFIAVIFYGACGLGDLAASILATVGPSPFSSFERYELADSGVPLHISYGKGGVIATVHDLDGKPVTDPNYQPDRIRNHMRYMNGFSEYVGDSHGHHPWRYEPSYRESRAYLWTNSPYSYPRLEQWFVLIKQNILIGFLPQQKMPFGFIDQTGFEPMSAKPQGSSPDVQFSYATEDSYCIWSPTLARYAFLAEHRVIDLALPAPGPIYGVGSAWGETPKGGSVSVIGLTLGTGLAVYNDKAHLVTMLPYNHDTDRWGALSLGVSGGLDHFYLRYDPSEWIDDATKQTMPSYIEDMDRSGQVLHVYTLPPLPITHNPGPWPAYFQQRLQSPAFFFGTMLYKEIGAVFGSTRLRGDLAWQFGHDRPLIREISLYATLLSLFLAVATFYWAGFASFSRQRAWAWTAFVFAFGLAGFITFRLAADWPRTVPCPSCPKRRPVEDINCPHCDAEWPAPPVTGIEIIDRPEAEALNHASV